MPFGLGSGALWSAVGGLVLLGALLSGPPDRRGLGATWGDAVAIRYARVRGTNVVRVEVGDTADRAVRLIPLPALPVNLGQLFVAVRTAAPSGWSRPV